VSAAGSDFPYPAALPSCKLVGPPQRSDGRALEMPMRLLTSGVLIGMLLATAACSDSPTGIARSASGSWVQQEQIPGSSLHMTLVASGSSLSGTGTWVAEAGPGGTLTATGAVQGSSVNLDLVLTANTTGGPLLMFDEHFTGHLQLDKLVGTMTFGPPSNPTSQSSVTFVRP